MKIERALIQNFKGVKIVDISLAKNMILITGQNGSGKSSFLDGIMTALSGKDKSIIQPVHDGADRALMKINLDGYTVTRVITEKTNRLEITSDNGDVKKSPQEWLNEHIGNLKFDPIEFSKMDDKKQRQVLIDLAGLNLEEEDEKIKAIYNERQLVGRDLEKVAVQDENTVARSMVLSLQEEVNITELSKKITELSEKHNKYVSAQSQIGVIDSEIDRLLKRIDELKVERIPLIEVKDIEEDLESLKNSLANAEQENAKIRNAKTIMAADGQYKEINNRYNELTAKLEEQRNIKLQLLSAAKFPIDGLTIDDDGVFYNNIPFSQLSSSQKIVIGTMIAIELIPENGVKLIIIREGSLLDNKALDYLEKVSKEKDVQFLIEYVTDDEKKGIYIEEGEIK